MRDKNEIRALLERYMRREANEDERIRLFAALEKEKDFAEWQAAIKELIEEQSKDTEYDADRWESVVASILKRGNPNIIDTYSALEQKTENEGRKNIEPFRKRFRSVRIVAAAIIALLLGLGIWFALQDGMRKDAMVASESKVQKSDISPGGNKAVLILSNGKKIFLDSINSGLLSKQGNTKVIKVNSGLLTYDHQSSVVNRSSTIKYNTISTPRGGQYKVVLPDGSKVWLNAASSIRFPTASIEEKRHVFIQGEAYFEIAKNEVKPFIVSVNDMQVKVLGTHFNIMAYENEPAIKTTLLEGAVKVLEGKSIIKLDPGQQLSVNKEGGARLVKNVNISEAVAWKNGLFQFSDADVATIMRQIGRWYNVQIVYINGIPSGSITGKIPRNTNLSNVLKIMKLSGVHFKVKGKKLIVLNS